MLWFRKKKKEEITKTEIDKNISEEISIDEDILELNEENIETPKDESENDIIEEIENIEINEDDLDNIEAIEEIAEELVETILEQEEVLNKSDEENKNSEENIDEILEEEKDTQEVEEIKESKIPFIDEKYLDDFSKPSPHDLICDSTQKPIYIIGGGNIGSYLALKLKKYGHKVVIISSPLGTKILKTEGVNIFEEFSGNNTNSVFDTSLQIAEEPKMIILATKSNKLKLALTAINKKILNKCPIIDFSIRDNTQYIRNFVGYANISNAFFDGNISKNKYGKTQILGDKPKIFVSPANGYAHKEIYNILSSTGLPVRTITDKIACFWNLFTPYFIGSIITSLYNQKLKDILDNKKRKKIIYACIDEIYNLAKAEKVELNKELILKKLNNISDEHTFPLHRDVNIGKVGESGELQTMISEKTEVNKVKCKIIRSIFKQIYNYILM